MGFKVRYSDPDITTKAGFGKVAHLPFILDSRPGYHRWGSRYLIDRGLGYWEPVMRGRGVQGRRPTRQTMRNYAHWLANFLEWSEARGVDLGRCDYASHVRDGYQRDMLEGRWSASERALGPATVNVRVQQACDFLSWMSDKGLRSDFLVPTETVRVHAGTARSSVGHRAFEVTRRVGKVRQNKRSLRMPTREQLVEWLASVLSNDGPTLALACETILLTALRLEELVALRVDTLPEDRREWHVANPDAPRDRQEVLVEVKYGAKGPDYGLDHDDKVGPARTIRIPLALAEKWHAYRQTARNDALRKALDAAPSLAVKKRLVQNTVHLFLNERTGARLTGDNVYRAWKRGRLPFTGWSPHMGRDWWACSTLLAECQKLEHLRSMGPGVAAQLLEATAVTVIRLRIQPQLGHASENTTRIYLQWIEDQFGMALSIDYDAAFEAATCPNEPLFE